MNEHPYYPAGTQVKMIDIQGTNADELNDFLIEYEGFILDIKPMGLMHGLTRYVIIYKAFE